MATIEDVHEFLKHTAPTYMLATVDGEGNPRVRPFGTADLFEGRLYIQTGKKKEVYKQTVAHPEVEICAWKGADWWRIQGEPVPDERIEAKKAPARCLSRTQEDVRRERRQHDCALLQACDCHIHLACRQAFGDGELVSGRHADSAAESPSGGSFRLEDAFCHK